MANVLEVSLKELWHFGSRARGDNRETSDYDKLIVAEGCLPELREIVSEANYTILNTAVQDNYIHIRDTV